MNIQIVIQNTYNINIQEVNLLELYKITDRNIASDELEHKLASQRSKWEKSSHNANETIAARAKARLSQADTYEAILRNPEYLEELFDFYEGKNTNAGATTTFSRDFFTFIKEANKSVGKKDFKFFIQYFREERKNQKAILEMLKKDFNVVGLKDDTGETEAKEISINEDQGFVTKTRFQEESVCLLHKSELLYRDLQQSAFLQTKFPDLKGTMYQFLNLEDTSFSSFAMYVDEAIQKVFAERQKDSVRGNEYIPLSDFLNAIKDLLKCSDVSENFLAFKKLIQYPNFTPYLYLVKECNVAILDKLLEKVGKEYGFENFDNFLFLYFKPLADGKHFSFTIENKLEKRLRKIQQDPEVAEQESGRRNAAARRRKQMPLPLHILRFLATWPLVLVQCCFEAFRFVVLALRQQIWSISVLLVFFLGYVFNFISVLDEIKNIATNFSGSVLGVIHGVTNTYEVTGFEFVIGFLLLVVQFLFKFGLAPALFAIFFYNLSKALDRTIDLTGYHKTFQKIRAAIDENIIHLYKHNRKKLYTFLITSIVCNVIAAGIALVVIRIILLIYYFLTGNYSPAGSI